MKQKSKLIPIKSKRGRPSNAERARRANAEAITTTTPPKVTLEAIAADTTAPAAARVSACKALLKIADADRTPKADKSLSGRALQLLADAAKGGRR